MTQDNFDRYRPGNEDPEQLQSKPLDADTEAWYKKGDTLRNEIKDIDEWLAKWESAPEEWKQHEMSQAAFTLMSNKKQQLEAQLADYNKEFEEEQMRAMNEMSNEDLIKDKLGNYAEDLEDWLAHNFHKGLHDFSNDEIDEFINKASEIIPQIDGLGDDEPSYQFSQLMNAAMKEDNDFVPEEVEETIVTDTDGDGDIDKIETTKINPNILDGIKDFGN